MQVRGRHRELVDLGASVLVVSFAPVDALEDYREHLRLPFPVAADPDRRAYSDYGLLEGSRWQVWHPRTLWRYLVLTCRGMRPRLPAKGEDLSQLGGDFVISAGGAILLAHRSGRPDDRPDLSVLVDALREAS